jgi:hypothetical protein
MLLIIFSKKRSPGTSGAKAIFITFGCIKIKLLWAGWFHYRCILYETMAYHIAIFILYKFCFRPKHFRLLYLHARKVIELGLEEVGH